MEWLKGKKTIIGSLLLSLLSTVYLLDTLIDGEVNWISKESYLAIGGIITGLTGAALRVGLKNTIK